ncbi:guanylate kinase [Terrisporobacter sp.]|uniref:guanylate kinase n=1 Tax=Terrisporobacter sp. TaxID=1965305 RepID=UPI00260CDA51|nr:guanylate kinase [Terrisporobacter sp.]
MVINKKGLLLVVSGPSGAGKGTICKVLMNRNNDLKLSVSATTRQPRNGEVEGENYYFLTHEKFNDMISKNEFLEYAQTYSNFYGTPKGPVMESLEKGQDVVLEIEMQGARQVKQIYPEAILIFVLPPSLNELENRLSSRGTETKEQMQERLSCAFEEIKQIKDYNYFIFNETNREVEAALEIEHIISAEKNKSARYEEEIIRKFREEL